MGSCPFCGGEVSEDLERFGGVCPHCFGEIPGEEAATDPGEEVKAQLRAEDDRRKRAAAMRPVLIAVPLTLAVLGIVYVNIAPEPMAEPLEFGADEMAFEIDIAELDTDAAWEQRKAVAKAEAEAEEAARLAATRRAKAKQAGVVPAAGEPDGSIEPAAKATVGDNGMVMVASRRRGPVLADRADIKAAFQDVFRSRAGRLEICLKKALQTTPNLKGSWVFSIVIDKQGAFTEVEVTGKGMTSPGFESCLQKEVSMWRLGGELEKPWPVSFPINFG